MKNKAWEQYRRMPLSIYDLRMVVIHSKGELRDAAWQEFLKKNPTSKDLEPIAKIGWADQDFREEVERVQKDLQVIEELRKKRA